MGCLIMTARESTCGKTGWIRTYVNKPGKRIGEGLKNFFHFGVVIFQNEMGVLNSGRQCF
jgi:hypothetical protein